MEPLSQDSRNQVPNASSYRATAAFIEDATAKRIVSGRAVSPASSGAFGVNCEDFTADRQKEIGISSRAVALDSDTCEATQCKRLFTGAGDIALRVKPKASLPRFLTKFKASPGGNTAILNKKQVKLIQKVFDGRSHELSEEEFKSVIGYFSRKNFRDHVPRAYLESPALMKEFLRNGILKVHEIPKNKLTKDILLSKSGFGISCCDFVELPDELKTDLDFLIEYSARKGIPFGTPPELAVLIYDHLDITEKIKSLNQLPDSFKNKNDDFYDELIHSGMIELKDLPEHVKNKSKEYCLSQLSKGLCELSEVPVHLLTKESILDSIKGEYYYFNFLRVFFDQFKVFIKDSVFFEEVLIRAVTADLENVIKYDDSLKYSSGDLCMMQAYCFASKRYKSDAEMLALLFEKLVRVNPFFLVYIEDLNGELPQNLIEKAKDSLLKILSGRPEVIPGFHVEVLKAFFDKVNADNEFKSHVLSIVYQYFPYQNNSKTSEDILQQQDKIVLDTEPFDRGYSHFLSRKLRPAKPQIVLDYIKRNLNFLYFFNDKEYLKRCCIDPIIRQKLIHILAERLVADKQALLIYWQDRLPRRLLDDTLKFLKDPALFSKLDSSDKLSEPVNPLKFQLPNTSAFELLVAVHASGFKPADIASGRQLQSEFAHADETGFQRVYSGQDSLSLFEKEGTIVGGRTLAIPNGEEVDYYKFHRVGECMSTLAQEGIMHQFIAKSDRFKSQKPRFGQYLAVLEKDLPEKTRDFTDRLQVINVNGERAVLVYHFKATKDYGVYAHTPDEKNTPYGTAERGLLNGIHDIGLLNGQFGIMPSSTIPSFHAIGRRWVFLSPLLGNSEYFALPLPGDFKGWIEAIERPDFGWAGLRDWGDVEFYGSMKSGLAAADSKSAGYTPEVMQRLSFANALCENLLAAVLLRSRLRRDSPDYHYQKQSALKETENFIEQLLNEYLSGLFAKEKELQPKARLQEFMGLNDTKYRSWLTRTAQEILYWTALQPHEVKDPCAFPSSVECYSEHLKKNGHLDEMLYSKLHPVDTQKKFPGDFCKANGQLNLGAINGVFPLVSLTKGLTLLAGNIFAFSDQYSEDDNLACSNL